MSTLVAISYYALACFLWKDDVKCEYVIIEEKASIRNRYSNVTAAALVDMLFIYIRNDESTNLMVPFRMVLCTVHSAAMMVVV